MQRVQKSGPPRRRDSWRARGESHRNVAYGAMTSAQSSGPSVSAIHAWTTAVSTRYAKSVPRHRLFSPNEVTATTRLEDEVPRNTGPPESPLHVPAAAIAIALRLKVESIVQRAAEIYERRFAPSAALEMRAS